MWEGLSRFGLGKEKDGCGKEKISGRRKRFLGQKGFLKKDSGTKKSPDFSEFSVFNLDKFKIVRKTSFRKGRLSGCNRGKLPVIF